MFAPLLFGCRPKDEIQDNEHLRKIISHSFSCGPARQK